MSEPTVAETMVQAYEMYDEWRKYNDYMPFDEWLELSGLLDRE